MSPVGGPALGPFLRRSDALEAEVALLEANWLLQDDQEPGEGPECASPFRVDTDGTLTGDECDN